MGSPIYEVMIRQVEELACDLRTLVAPVAEDARNLLTSLQWNAIERVYLAGNGDSYHAACAAQMSFEVIARTSCQAVSAFEFLEYRAPHIREYSPGSTLLIAISASGNTQPVLQSIMRAKRFGAHTVAVTSTPGSAIVKETNNALVVNVPKIRRSPGIRSYQASLIGLMLTAIQLAESRAVCSAHAANGLRHDLINVADTIDATVPSMKTRCDQIAAIIAEAPALVVLGSGPSYGTASFSAAKMVEAAGMFAISQDLEEWKHVERFAYPANMPVIILGPPGHSYDLAVQVASAAKELGRRVIAVTGEDDTEIKCHAWAVLPVCGRSREEFSPLLYHLFASYIASFAGEYLGRKPFQAS